MSDDERPEVDSELPTVPRPAGATGQTIAGYRVLQMLGEGGMGVVYEAQQEKPVRRRVALKLIKPGMDSGQVVARFESERQALALMSHPTIASIYDGGATEDGRPYFAMELVHGEPLTEYCDRNRLMIKERLDVFIQVCEGVQHAHQKGIIHRDLKPSNILVTIRDDKPVPKIIDFGVAKATSQRLTDKTLYTQLGQWMGTPVYMSPEQAEMTGVDVDTRSDVYSLGVVLYELIVGSLPFDPTELRKAGFEGFARFLRETEPKKPSTKVRTLARTPADPARTRRLAMPALEKELRGDLDWITMKALEKDRTRRYGSVSELAADIRRHLCHEPVVASPPRMVYRARKFVRRHRFSVAVSVVLISLLVGFSVVLAVQAARVEAARQEAERRFNEVRTLANSVLFEMYDAIEDLPGSTSARQLLVQRSLEYLDRLAQEAGGDTSLQLELATAYSRVGDVQGRPFQPNLGDSQGALDSYGKAVELLEAVTAASPVDRAARGQLANTLVRLATLLDDWRADTPAALELVGRALALQRELVAAEPDALDHQRRMSYALVKMGDLQDRTGRLRDALETFREYLQVCEAVAARSAHPPDPKHLDDLRSVRVAQFRLAEAMSRLEDHVGAVRYARAAFESARQATAAHPDSARARRDQAATAILLGDVLSHSGSPRDAIPLYEDALALHRATADRDTDDAMASFDVAVAATRLGGALEEVGDTRGALQRYRDVLPRLRRLIEQDPENAEYHSTTAAVEADVGQLLLRSGDASGALAASLRALAWFEPAAERSPERVQARYDLAAVLLGAGRVHLALAADSRSAPAERQGHRQEGCIQLTRSLELWQGLSGPAPISHMNLGAPETQVADVEQLLDGCTSPQASPAELGLRAEKLAPLVHKRPEKERVPVD